MKTNQTYIDLGAGVAGDMLLGAMIDLGLSVPELTATLQRTISIKDFKIISERTERQKWPARNFVVKGDRPFGGFPKMRNVIAKAALPVPVKMKSLEILKSLDRAEQKAHGTKSSDWDPNGLGLLDTLVDVLGTSWGFWKLSLQSVKASALNTGRIAPATAALLKENTIPSYTTQSQLELATPTGVAIVSAFVEEFGTFSFESFHRAGYGAGQRDTPDHPNVLAIYLGGAKESHWGRDQVILLETLIDDMDPRLYPHVTELLFEKGALDVWWSAVGMKKGRPGISFSVLCSPEKENLIVEVLFQETTTLGIRRLPVQRHILPRESKGLYKIAILAHGQNKRQVEYEKARKRAESLSVPLRELLR